jgi:nucleoside transporter
MVFLHYFVWSCWYNTMAVYLGKLNFTGTQIGLAYGTTAIGALVSPFLIGVIADRYVPAQRLLGGLHLLGAGLLWWISQQTSFSIFYPSLIVYTLTYMAGHGLINTITLTHAPNPAKWFPIVMAAASAGWIAANITIGHMQIGDKSGIFSLAAVVALCVGLYSFLLPNTPPKGDAGPVSAKKLLGLDALKLFKDRSFATFMVCSFLICIPLSFYFTWTSAFLKEAADGKITAAILPQTAGSLNGYELLVATLNYWLPDASKMSLGQVSEMAFLAAMAWLISRLGIKKIMVIGILAWAVRFSLFSFFNENPSATTYAWALIGGILLHGMCYDFIFVMGRMYVDKAAGDSLRASAQGLHAVFTLGAGMFVGSWLSGVVGEYFTKDGGHNWTGIWLVPAIMALTLTPIFILLFREKSAEEPHA